MLDNKGGSFKGKFLILMFTLFVVIAIIGCAAQNQGQQNQQTTQPPTAQTAEHQNNSHSKMGIKCEQCHTVEGQPVTRQQCSSCHKSMDDLISKTKNMDPNPHGPHHYDLEDCSICHSVHDKSQMMCYQCHDFPWMKELGENWELVEYKGGK